jgi:hypothetical protein
LVIAYYDQIEPVLDRHIEFIESRLTPMAFAMRVPTRLCILHLHFMSEGSPDGANWQWLLVPE